MAKLGIRAALEMIAPGAREKHVGEVGMLDYLSQENIAARGSA